jgi:hypothetical protein
MIPNCRRTRVSIFKIGEKAIAGKTRVNDKRPAMTELNPVIAR